MLRSLQYEKEGALPGLLRLGRWMRPCAVFAAMFLLVRAPLMMQASPLAAAMMAAAPAAGDSAAACVLGCLLGMLRLPLYASALLPAFSCVLVLLGMLICSLLHRDFARGDACVSFTAGAAAMLPAMVAAGGASLPSLQAFACGAVAACAAPFLRRALEIGAGRDRLNTDEKTGAALLAGGCIAGLQNLCPPVAQGFAALLVLLTPSLAPANGVFAGLALCAGGADAGMIASLSLCALATGQGFLPQRWQRSLGLCFASGLGWLLAGPGALDVRWALCAAAAYPLLPEPLLERLNSVLSPRREPLCDPACIAREAVADNRRRLSALAEAFFAMAQEDARPLDVPDEQELIQQMRARLCAGCTGYAACWAGESNRAVHLLCQLIGDALERTDAPPGQRTLFAEGEIPPEVLRTCRRGRLIPDRLGLLLRDFAQKRHSEIKRCENNQLLSLQLMQAGEILQAMAEAPPLPDLPGRILAALDASGLPPCCAAPMPGGGAMLIKDVPWTPGEIRCTSAALQRQMKLRFLLKGDGEALRLVPAPHLQAEAAASCQSGVAGQSCGDSHLIRMLDDHRLLLAISDGMGTGDAARQESMQAIRLLFRFLDAGISRPLALETLNRQLLLRSGDEIFATIDLCIIDLCSGVAEITKLAACRTIILRGGETLRIDGGHLPLGILEQVRSDTSRIRLRPGDVLVMGSDGVMETADPLLIERAARENAALSPEQLAGCLVRRADLGRGDAGRDDLTCICARISSAV